MLCVVLSNAHEHFVTSLTWVLCPCPSSRARTAKTKQVVIGTLNVLGNARNPIEFCPKQFMTPEWERASNVFAQALFGVTFK